MALKSYSYNPPKLKPSSKPVEVTNEEGEVVCTLKRSYPNLAAKVCVFIFDIDWSAQVEVFSREGQPVFQCKKRSLWFGRPEYIIQRCNTEEVFHVTYLTWQKVAPEFKITYQDQEYVLKKEMLDWARFLQAGKELARWRMKSKDGFKTRLEIEADCPIQEPEFFVALFHCLFYIGD